MIDLFLAGVTALLLLSLGAFLFYYRRIRKLTEEYEGAKALVGDIVASFNKQFRSQEDKLFAITQKIISFASKSGKVDNKTAKQEEQIKQIHEVQKYGVDLLSTLVFATKKNKE